MSLKCYKCGAEYEWTIWSKQICNDCHMKEEEAKFLEWAGQFKKMTKIGDLGHGVEVSKEEWDVEKIVRYLYTEARRR